MKPAGYQALHDYVSTHSGIKRLVGISAKKLPYVHYVGYPLVLLWLLFTGHSLLLRSIIVPAIGLVAATVVRSGLNLKRPYEAMGIPAVFPKSTSGKSFPSRHAACAGVIAVTVLRVLPPVGWVLLVLGAGISASRVLAGVHYIRDVAFGFFLGCAIGWLGMFLI